MPKKTPADDEEKVDRDRYFADAHAARMKAFREDPDFVIAAEVSAIDDGRTCDACRALDGKRFKLEDVPDLPYAQCTSEMGCRCLVVPFTVIDD